MKTPIREIQPSEQRRGSALRDLKMLSITEPLGAIAIALGLITQLATFCFVPVMIGAIQYKRKTKLPFMSKGSAGGWEFELLLLVASLSVVLLGPGRISLDHLLFGINNKVRMRINTDETDAHRLDRVSVRICGFRVVRVPIFVV